jgi:hypothetical protein
MEMMALKKVVVEKHRMLLPRAIQLKQRLVEILIKLLENRTAKEVAKEIAKVVELLMGLYNLE